MSNLHTFLSTILFVLRKVLGQDPSLHGEVGLFSAHVTLWLLVLIVWNSLIVKAALRELNGRAVTSVGPDGPSGRLQRTARQTGPSLSLITRYPSVTAVTVVVGAVIIIIIIIAGMAVFGWLCLFSGPLFYHCFTQFLHFVSQLRFVEAALVLRAVFLRCRPLFVVLLRCASVRLSAVVGSRAQVSAACQVARWAIPDVFRPHVAGLAFVSDCQQS